MLPAQSTRAGLAVSWARHHDEVRQAQRLRYNVFADEMGARLPTSIAGHDIDLFDDYCEHLLVRDVSSGAGDWYLSGADPRPSQTCGRHLQRHRV